MSVDQGDDDFYEHDNWMWMIELKISSRFKIKAEVFLSDDIQDVE